MSTLKLENIKHENSSTNNMVMDSDGSVSVTGNLAVDTNTLKVDATNNRVGIGTSTPDYDLTVEGSSHPRIKINSTNNTASGLFMTVRNSGTLTGTATTRIDETGNYTIYNGTTSSPLNMNIDASGRVTKPNQPAFFARHTTASAYTSAYITNWSSVTYNVGNHFNGSTGVFTSPVAGVYQLNAMIGNNYANGIGNYDVRVNNTQVAGFIFDPFASQNTWATNVLVGQVKVNANDTVRIYVNGAGYPDNASWTSWSMYLLG